MWVISYNPNPLEEEKEYVFHHCFIGLSCLLLLLVLHCQSSLDSPNHVHFPWPWSLAFLLISCGTQGAFKWHFSLLAYDYNCRRCLWFISMFVTCSSLYDVHPDWNVAGCSFVLLHGLPIIQSFCSVEDDKKKIWHVFGSKWWEQQSFVHWSKNSQTSEVICKFFTPHF